MRKKRWRSYVPLELFATYYDISFYLFSGVIIFLCELCYFPLKYALLFRRIISWCRFEIHIRISYRHFGSISGNEYVNFENLLRLHILKVLKRKMDSCL
jgi:hypothetical protein